MVVFFTSMRARMDIWTNISTQEEGLYAVIRARYIHRRQLAATPNSFFHRPIQTQRWLGSVVSRRQMLFHSPRALSMCYAITGEREKSAQRASIELYMHHLPTAADKLDPARPGGPAAAKSRFEDEPHTQVKTRTRGRPPAPKNGSAYQLQRRRAGRGGRGRLGRPACPCAPHARRPAGVRDLWVYVCLCYSVIRKEGAPLGSESRCSPPLAESSVGFVSW